MNFQKISLVTFFALTLTACQPPDTTAINSLKESLAAAKNDIEVLKNENLKLATANQELTKSSVQIKDLQNIYQRLMTLEQYKSVEFDPSEQRSYQRLDTNNGYFLVILDNVSTYLDGQKVTLTIGNPSSIQYSGFKLKATWGMRYPAYDGKFSDEWAKKYEEASASTQTKEISLTDALPPGTWTKVTFNLSPATSKNFGRLSLEMTTNNVRMKSN